jgi:hypothetical protein
MKALFTRGIVAGLVAIGTVGAAATAASATQPGIKSVTFSGTAGLGHPSPTVTITGTGFGSEPPPGTSDSDTSCGNYGSGNGDVYGNKLYFNDDGNGGNFEAGYSDKTGANCIGIIVVSWSPKKVVLQFGTAYGGYSTWDLQNGDGYALALKNGIYGGTVSGLSTSSSD